MKVKSATERNHQVNWLGCCLTALADNENTWQIFYLIKINRVERQQNKKTRTPRVVGWSASRLIRNLKSSESFVKMERVVESFQNSAGWSFAREYSDKKRKFILHIFSVDLFNRFDHSVCRWRKANTWLKMCHMANFSFDVVKRALICWVVMKIFSPPVYPSDCPTFSLLRLLINAVNLKIESVWFVSRGWRKNVNIAHTPASLTHFFSHTQFVVA